ncbi:nicotinate-nucleotide--dimethylbenzimidazole phosphoribosyltransferase [Streptomyces sp. NA04227]|uniref:nicotinate-nucleotide--dimethylbenzimidazole phosphoribosyltransferase n=1 Tax=Streptomyces sp. NA04227 TaxID=2742136 RepID=UPI001591B842|nr:nicotinate-nucleotide--dimethylbenzimidazole phosphoribosyltransferase [Streptomyces sp. NA04227]QKW05548.1 nicotinate-nucleotide--dimethylbenzimidazole phosphoribosyltransferase [Streptomyces sp. NA04227]
MTDTGRIPGEGLPEGGGMVEQPGVHTPGAYTYLPPSAPSEDDDLLLMPGAQSAWTEGMEGEPPVQEPYPAQQGAHERSGRDSTDVDMSAHTAAVAHSAPARRPLHPGPHTPAGPVRSLADRGPAADPTPVTVPGPATGPEYLDIRAESALSGDAQPQGAEPWTAQPLTEAPAETVVPDSTAFAQDPAYLAAEPYPQQQGGQHDGHHQGQEPVNGPAAGADSGQYAYPAQAPQEYAHGDPAQQAYAEVPAGAVLSGAPGAQEAGVFDGAPQAGAVPSVYRPASESAAQGVPFDQPQVPEQPGMHQDPAFAGPADAGTYPQDQLAVQQGDDPEAIDRFVPVDGILPTTPHLAPTPPHALRIPQVHQDTAPADATQFPAEAHPQAPHGEYGDQAAYAEQGHHTPQESDPHAEPAPEQAQFEEQTAYEQHASYEQQGAYDESRAGYEEPQGPQVAPVVESAESVEAAGGAEDAVAAHGAVQFAEDPAGGGAAVPGPQGDGVPQGEGVGSEYAIPAEQAVQPEPGASAGGADGLAVAPIPGPADPELAAPEGQLASQEQSLNEQSLHEQPQQNQPHRTQQHENQPHHEQPHQDAPHAQSPEQEAVQQEAIQQEGPQQEAPQQELPHPDAPHQPELTSQQHEMPEQHESTPHQHGVPEQHQAPETPAPEQGAAYGHVPAPAAEPVPLAADPAAGHGATGEQPVAGVPAPRDGETVVAAGQAQPVPAEAADGSATAAPDGTAQQEERPERPPAAPAYGDAEREAVMRVIRERRDIRNGFRDDPIPHEVLLRVLEAAHTAPSVGHSQPWDFVVIRSAETRRTMHELAMRQREAYAKSLPRARAKQFKELKIEAILDTPVNIVVTADPTRGGRHTLGRHTQPQMAPYSSALAVENLWLAARAEGLGVGWVSFFDEREMVRTLGLPEHLEVVAYLCVGYVDEFPEDPELMQAGWSKRRPLSWVVHEETYGRRALPGEEPHDLLAETVAGIRPLDAKALGEAWERQKRMTKPAGALGMLEIISAQLSGLSRMCPPPIPEPAAVAIFAGDHGVHAQKVTPWPQEVTAQMVNNFLAGGAVCNAFASQVGAEVCVIDVGVASELPATPGLLPRKIRPGTADMTEGPALSREEVVAAIEVGIETARDLVSAGNKALLTGEMGIANTTASAALISVFTDTDPAEVTGRGTGINDEMLAHKTEVVRRALALHQPDPADPIGVLAAVGGLEHAALVGLLLGGASLRTPVILDGVSAGAAALVARAIAPESLAACMAGHRSAEPGHVAALNKLGLRPLVDLDLRLGEGTGALLALPVVQSAARAMHEVATFDSAGVTEK